MSIANLAIFLRSLVLSGGNSEPNSFNRKKRNFEACPLGNISKYWYWSLKIEYAGKEVLKLLIHSFRSRNYNFSTIIKLNWSIMILL